MTMDFMKDKPIYQQLVDRICGDIIRGSLKPGDRLPSVREYAVEAGVNANTMQRVYKELEHMEVTETKRGQGTFVTENQQCLHELREKMKHGLVDHFIRNMESLGFTQQEMVEALQLRSRGESV